MRDHIFFLLNGSPIHATGREALSMLAPFLRQSRGLTGTKIACAQGACGSCTVLLGRPVEGSPDFDYAPINSCILPVTNCDGCHVITVEGVNGAEHAGGGADETTLSPVQSALVNCHGAQCGFCTPGMVLTLTAWREQQGKANALHDGANGAHTEADLREDVTKALEGNLCRCTGYAPIVEAALHIEAGGLPLNEWYPPEELRAHLRDCAQEEVSIAVPADSVQGAQTLYAPATWDDALKWKAAHEDATALSGGSEIGVLMNTKGLAPQEVLSLTRVEGLDKVAVDDGHLVLGGGANWLQVAEVARTALPEFARLLARWGSPQLRRAGTVAGNLVRASPLSDSLPLLLVCEALIELESASGRRLVLVDEFLGEDGPTLRSTELVRRVRVPLPPPDVTLRLIKVSKRRAFDRSIVSAAFWLRREGDTIAEARLAYGGVGPRTLRLPKTEEGLRGAPLAPDTWRDAGSKAVEEVSSKDDPTSTYQYRDRLVANLLRKFGAEL